MTVFLKYNKGYKWYTKEGISFKGYFYIEVPNDNQALNRYLNENEQKSFSKFMYQKAHYYSFTIKTLTKLILFYHLL